MLVKGTPGIIISWTYRLTLCVNRSMLTKWQKYKWTTNLIGRPVLKINQRFAGSLQSFRVLNHYSNPTENYRPVFNYSNPNNRINLRLFELVGIIGNNLLISWQVRFKSNQIKPRNSSRNRFAVTEGQSVQKLLKHIINSLRPSNTYESVNWAIVNSDNGLSPRRR